MKAGKQNELNRILGILYQALASDFGIEVRSSDPVRARQRLYEARRSTSDPALAILQFRLSPSDRDCILITKGKKDE